MLPASRTNFIHISVSERSDFLLRYNDLAAHRAMFSRSPACRGAGRRHLFVHNFRVSERSDFLLRHKHLMTNRTMLSFCFARLSAGRLYCFIHHFRVSERSDFFLFRFAAFGALAFLDSLFGTGCVLYGRILSPLVYTRRAFGSLAASGESKQKRHNRDKNYASQ